MRRRLVAVSIASLLFAGGLSPAAAQQPTDLSQYVDPLIGTYPPGFVNPGPVLPHGMVGLGPDTEGPFNYGGYHYINNTITGFSHIHMSAGVPRGGQIPVMPVAGQVRLEAQALPEGSPVPAYASPFSHARETAEAGYYSVDLLRYGITAELTATERVGMHSYTFPPGVPASVVFDPSRDLQGFHQAEIVVGDDGIVSGSVVAERGIKVYFAAEFDRQFTGRTFTGTTVSDSTTASGTRAGAILDFGTTGGEVLGKVGISFVDVAGARNNIDSEIPGWDFEAVRVAARAKWDEALARIELAGGTLVELRSFYTALYHAQLFPNIFSDADGRYIGFDDVVRTSDRTHYTQFSLWDSYRGQNQLLSVINPDAYDDMVWSLLEMYRQGGTLPRWTFANRDPAHMSGDPVIPFIGEGWCRGLLDDLPSADRAELLDAMRALTAARDPAYFDESDEDGTPARGFVPTDVPAPREEPLAGQEVPGSEPVHVVEGGPRQAGTTLEYGIADFALALMTASVGRAIERDQLLATADNYRNLLDPETRWIRPRHADGSWLQLFAPENGYGFQEGTSWQYSWLAMQDLAGLFERMGGNDVVQQRLDAFFNLPATGAVPVAWPKVQNQATAFGLVYKGNQYAPGNEHDLQAPYLYNYAGAPWKTQAVARGVASLFTPTPDGLPGNDDLGALSGWLVWTMLGIYPMTPGAPLYTIASPVFTHAVIHSPSGDITIDSPGSSTAAKYVQAATLDGSELDRSHVTHGELAGKTLHLDMDAVPHLEWASNSAPPSLSTHDLTVFGCPEIETDDPDPIATTLILEVAGKGSKRQLIATLTETGSDKPIKGAAIAFAADGVSLCTAPTDGDGRATCDLDPRYQGGHHTYTARFEGTDSHDPSSAEAST